MNKRRPSSAPPHRAIQPTHWGNVAEWYDALVGDQGSEYHQQVILPGVLRLLQLPEPIPPSYRLLDLACGQGVLCRELAQRHIPTLGIDAAAPLIHVAQQRNVQDRLPISYQVADATKLLPLNPNSPVLAPNSYEAITIILAMQNITPLSPVWQVCRQLLKPEGRLIVVLMHPCFRIPKQSAWHWDEKAQTQSRLVTQYLTSSKVEIQMNPGQAAAGQSSQTTLTFHRPLQAYMNTLGSAGLWIDHIEEWPSHKKSQRGPKQKPLDASRKEIPLFLALRARPIDSQRP